MHPVAARGAPHWLRGLLSEEFFDACAAHPGERKNDKNHFCVDCAAPLCRHCLPHEHVHDVLQIWKYASCFVVRIDDLKLFDCTGIQSHTVSDHEVVFLNERTARKRSTSAENPCAACARPLLPGHDYCSLFCKVKHLGESEHELRRALRVSRQEVAPTPEPQTGRKRSSSSSDAGPSCSGSFRKRSRKQAEPAQAPFH
ncbi:PLATZ transcription factor family protein [Zea mays]|uniref:PLATZ transcription factor family protein n=1 Tax=Zea mays TaxID=4577 RepID=A0A1D6Q6H4_MAIZE|nr:PLATZ transcription factor family protein [Zea mays]